MVAAEAPQITFYPPRVETGERCPPLQVAPRRSSECNHAPRRRRLVQTALFRPRSGAGSGVGLHPGLKNLVAAIIRFEHRENERALLGLIDLLNDVLDGKPELKRTFAIWIRALLLSQSRHTLALPKVRDLKELKMTLAERLDQWAQKYEQIGIERGIEKGIEQGIEKGEALVLQRLLTKRFGTLPGELVVTISTAPAAQIDVWVDRVIDAASLEEVFRP